MIQIPMRISGNFNRNNITSLNQVKLQDALSRQDLASINSPAPDRRFKSRQAPAACRREHPSYPQEPESPLSRPAAMAHRQIPALRNLIQKGQKVNIGIAGQLPGIRIAMGWNTNHPQCDIDLSAYLLDSNSRVPADDWFVFYGQTNSPDGSVTLNTNGSAEDQELADIDFTKLDPSISKIVFVLTINEAFTYNLNFSMVRDAYIRLLVPGSGRELYSFLLTDYYANVVSMMLGEIYLYNNTWKFNAIGNGVARDLAGLCELYGVQTA